MFFEDVGDLVFFVVIVELVIVNREGKIKRVKIVIDFDNWLLSKLIFVLFGDWDGEYFVIVFGVNYL